MAGFDIELTLKASDVKSVHSTEQQPLGTRGRTSDGRIFRYALNGATALVQGVPVQTAAIEVPDKDTEFTSIINDTEEITSTFRQMKIETELATKTIAANEYAEGYIRVANSTVYSGIKGTMVRIKSHDASATSSTDANGSTMTVVFADDDLFPSNLDTGAVVTLHHNPFWQVVVCVGGADSSLVGGIVGVPIVAVAANKYFWAQTWGTCAVLADGVISPGAAVQISTSTSDAVSICSTYTTSTDVVLDMSYGAGAGRQRIGFALGSPGTDAFYHLIFLTISP